MRVDRETFQDASQILQFFDKGQFTLTEIEVMATRRVATCYVSESNVRQETLRIFIEVNKRFAYWERNKDKGVSDAGS
jgi:hypothetical protein